MITVRNAISQTNDLHKSIHLALTEILFSIDTRGRVYIMEYDDEQSISCTYEVCSEGVTPVRLSLQKIPISTLPWSTRKIQSLYPVLINNLDELPAEASEEKRYLEKRCVRSSILIPLIIKGEPWGYMGVDIVDKHRLWSLEDYQDPPVQTQRFSRSLLLNLVNQTCDLYPYLWLSSFPFSVA